MTPIVIILAAILLVSCKSQQDRQYDDLQTILEHTQPSRNVR